MDWVCHLDFEHGFGNVIMQPSGIGYVWIPGVHVQLYSKQPAQLFPDR